jgi:hypothetical protein
MNDTALLFTITAGDVAVVSLVLFISFSLWMGVIATIVIRRDQTW